MSHSPQDFENRKKDHIRFALDEKSQARGRADYDLIQLFHSGLPEIKLADVSLKTHLLGHEFSSAHFVSSMTAGHDKSLEINLRLAAAAEKNNWLMSVGSQRKELTENSAKDEWLHIKTKYPHLKLISNIGMLELIHTPIEKITQLIENLDAIGIFIHINSLQEVFQGNQNIDFTGGLKAIEHLAKKSRVPILVKEVGFGFNKEVVESLFEVGAIVVDVSGKGGTHWGQVEALRSSIGSLEAQAIDAFNDWGFTTTEMLLELQEQVLFHQIWASGGVRSGVDSAKCLALGARAVGIAQPLMKAAVESEEAVDNKMKVFDYQLKVAMFCMGIKKYEEFLHKKVWKCRK